MVALLDGAHDVGRVATVVVEHHPHRITTERVASGQAVSEGGTEECILDADMPLPAGTDGEDMASPAVATSREKGIGIAAASPRDMDKADAADRKRQSFLRYLDDTDEAVHPLRLDVGETRSIGLGEYMLTFRPDGTFTDPVLRASSGSPQLDASARRAVLAASGKVRRPAIIGTEPIPVILHVKYQYGLR